MSDLEDLERTFRDRLDAIGPEARAILLHVLKLPDLERVRSIGEFYGDPRTQTFGEFLIDLEESPHARAFVLGELRERECAARLDEARLRMFAESSAVGRIADGSDRHADAIVSVSRLRGVE